MTTVLLADDDENFVFRTKRMLQDEGYNVITARNPAEASRALASHRVDVAIIDYRLKGGDNDRSGIEVATKADPRIPKIIVSDKVERKEVMEAVQTGPHGLALATRFLAKDDISPTNANLAQAVLEALELRRLWLRQARESVTPELYRDYRTASILASFQQILHVVANVAFVGLMIWAAVRLHAGVGAMILIMLGIIAGEITNIVLAKDNKEAIARADRYHSELVQAARFEQLLAACEALSGPAEINRAKREVIRSAAVKWFGSIGVMDVPSAQLPHSTSEP